MPSIFSFILGSSSGLKFHTTAQDDICLGVKAKVHVVHLSILQQYYADPEHLTK